MTEQYVKREYTQRGSGAAQGGVYGLQLRLLFAHLVPLFTPKRSKCFRFPRISNNDGAHLVVSSSRVFYAFPTLSSNLHAPPCVSMGERRILEHLLAAYQLVHREDLQPCK